MLPGSILGTSLGGATLGRAAGAFAGKMIDQALFSSSGQPRIVEGARLSDLQVVASSEGAHIPRLYGRARLAGQIIWATNFEEKVTTTTQSSGGGGKGGGGASTGTTVTRREYHYYANFAIGICAGPISKLGRVWADGKELDLSAYTYRFYTGSEEQQPDSLIEAKEGINNAPAYRGLAYIVFEHMPLERFGNRLPQLNFEVFRAVDEFEQTVRAVTILPGSGEFVYENDEVIKTVDKGVSVSENVHTRRGGSNWDIAIDDLEDTLPNARSASLVVSWFGSDLRASKCQLRPKVEVNNKTTTPYNWEVAGLSRADAQEVSRHADKPAFGGTPADKSVISAIKDLKSRGIRTVFYPFILMDVPADNSLPNPYGGNSQPQYPWRGRITCDLSADKTPASASEIAKFTGMARQSDFFISGENVHYTGPDEWSYRRMILHYANLCKAAGGIDAFLIGSEMRSLTHNRSSEDKYPFVAALIELAADVKAILGENTKITYAADWSEYFGHQPQDGSNDVYFNLDTLWASPNIDAIGIDCYWPLADWRQGEDHLDYLAGARTPYDLDYLKSNITGGEGYDWYYASEGDRDTQTRSPITDGYNKPWVWRYKDIKSWWLNRHYNRKGGVEDTEPTSWVPQSKPFWFTEVGCPAVDRGANQPNVFYDPKSSESALPRYSNGSRDDLMQRRFLQAIYEFYDPEHEDYVDGSNPQSGAYSGRMVDIASIFTYAWDARPYPAFPFNSEIWGDTANWPFGHWLNGRVADATLSQTVGKICEDYGFERHDPSMLTGLMNGYVVDRIMSARDALQPLELSFFFDSIETGGKIKFRHRGREGIRGKFTANDLVEESAEKKLYELTRSQETELPSIAKITYTGGTGDYRQETVEARRMVGYSERTSTAELAVVMDASKALNIAESWLQDAWAAREQATFSLPPSKMALEATDLLKLETGNRDYILRITELAEHGSREITALSIEPGIYEHSRTPIRVSTQPPAIIFGNAVSAFMDLPLLRGDEIPHAGYLAAYQYPWPGSVAFFRSPEETGYKLAGLVTAPATMGSLVSKLPPGPIGRWDHGSTMQVKLLNGELQSVSNMALLSGNNTAAIEHDNGEWEVIQFKTTELVADKTYELSQLLRGQAGTEHLATTELAAGAAFVLLDQAVIQPDMSIDEVGLSYNWKYGPANRDIGHNSYSTRQKAFSSIGLRPLSPVHIRATKSGDDVNISWKRRTRLNGDSWAFAEVPLAEDVEAYEIDIYAGSNIIRTIKSNTPKATYNADMQAADFVDPQDSLEIEIFQISATYGRGAGNHQVINL
jgi:hypothetical protein